MRNIKLNLVKIVGIALAIAIMPAALDAQQAGSSNAAAQDVNADQLLNDFAESWDESKWGQNFRGKAYMRANESSCLLYTSPSPRDRQKSRMPSSA